VISKFATDEDPDVIRDVRTSLTDMHEIFVTDKNYALYASFIRKTLQPALKRFGLMQKDGEAENVSLLRSSLIGFLADEGEDSAVMAFAEGQATAFLADPTTVDPSLIGICLTLACLNGDQALFDECRNRFETAKTPIDRARYLSCLGDFRDDQIVDQALAYALTGPLRSQERSRIPYSIAFQSSARQNFVLDWMMEHYDEIISQMPPPSRARLAYFLNGCDEARLAKGLAFFAEPEHNSPGINSRLARVAEAVSDCVSLRAREEGSVAAFLDEFVGAE
jgi:alanyl aminopeptidase